MADYIDLVERFPAGPHQMPGGDPFWVEHHLQKGKKIAVLLDLITIAAVEDGFPVITVAYKMRTDGTLVRDGLDAFVNKCWIGRFKSEKEAEEAIARVTGEPNRQKIEVVAVRIGDVIQA